MSAASLDYLLSNIRSSISLRVRKAKVISPEESERFLLLFPIERENGFCLSGIKVEFSENPRFIFSKSLFLLIGMCFLFLCLNFWKRLRSDETFLYLGEDYIL